jgi:hypothetical protein
MDSWPAGQAITGPVWKLKPEHRAHDSPTLVPTASQMNPVNILTPHFFKIPLTFISI